MDGVDLTFFAKSMCKIPINYYVQKSMGTEPANQYTQDEETRRVADVLFSLDIDEYRDGRYGCDSNATCYNAKGSLNDIYKLGFHGDSNKSCKGD